MDPLSDHLRATSVSLPGTYKHRTLGLCGTLTVQPALGASPVFVLDGGSDREVKSLSGFDFIRVF